MKEHSFAQLIRFETTAQKSAPSQKNLTVRRSCTFAQPFRYYREKCFQMCCHLFLAFLNSVSDFVKVMPTTIKNIRRCFRETCFQMCSHLVLAFLNSVSAFVKVKPTTIKKCQTIVYSDIQSNSVTINYM